MRLLIKGDRVMGSLPAEDPLVNAGQLCVKGRFCVTELVGSHLRLRKPSRREHSSSVQISWDEAVQLAAETLSACPPEQFALLISPDSSNEDLYVGQKFARVVMRTNNVDTGARLIYRSGFNAYLNLMKMAVPLANVREASTILCVGLDTRFGGSVVGVAIRQALIAHKWIQSIPGQELDFLNSLLRLTETAATPETESGDMPSDLTDLADLLKDTSTKVILVGSEYLAYRESSQIFAAIAQLARNTGSGVFPVIAQGNLLGSVLTGAYPELLPGAFPSNDETRLAELRKIWGADLAGLSCGWTSEALSHGHRMRALYLIGEAPFKADPPADFLIFQNIYPPPASYRADLVLPSAAFSETDGTLCNVEGRIQRMRKAVSPPGEALPDWDILCRIARKMGFKGFDFKSAGDIHQEISLMIEGFTNFQSPDRLARSLKCEGTLMTSQTVSPVVGRVGAEFPFILTSSISEHTYRGFPISDWVDGAKELFVEATVEMNPEDAAEAGITHDDEVLVISPTFEISRKARILNGQARGRLHISLRPGESIGANPHPARIVKGNV
jgi:predicted molibdopterin-dependent oxidoreductase YjgC